MLVNRRIFIGGIGSAIAGLPALGRERPQSATPLWAAWRKIPSIVAMSDEDDARLPAVYEAVGFWNAVLLNLGSGFRLGHVSHIAEAIPQNSAFNWWNVRFDLPARIAKVTGDIVVVLSDGSPSYATSYPAGPEQSQRVLVVIEV